jgi:hypothetical protein
MALADGAMRTNFGTVVGQGYTLTFNYRGPGLVDWWQFEGTPNDSVGAKNGTPMSVPVNYGTGEVEMGIQFPTNPAAPQGISFGTTAGNFGTNDFTIDYWMKTASTNAGEEFMEQGNTCRGSTNFWAIDIGNSNMNLPPGTPYLIVTNGTNYTLLPCTTNLIDSNWHHLAWVRKGTGYYLYLDGTNNNLTNSVITNSLSNGQPLILGNTNCFSTNGPVPYTGAVDELDIWNRALTDVEIAAIFEAGAFGKGTPVSILPNCGIVITSGTNSVTRTLIATNASSTNWLTNMVYFTAVGSNTTITLQGNPLGMLFDNFVVETPANLNFVQPEESLAPLIGQNPYGCWTLDVWDTRLDTTSTNNGVLYSWNLQMSVSSTNTSMIVLTNGYAYRGSVSAGGIAYFAFDVPAGANYVTNSLFNCLTNGFPAPLNLLFNQIALPVGNGLGDYTLLRNATNSASVLSNNAPPPALLPGARYYLGVQNTNSVAAAFSIEVWTNVPTATNIVALNFGYYSDFETISNAPEYYSFYVQPGTTNALFEIASTHYSSNELVLYIRHDLPLPTPTTYDYESSYFLTNGSPIVVSNTSTPVPLTSGTWYLAVYNSHTNVSMTYQVYGDTNVTTAPSAAVVSLAGMSAADNQFTLSWASVPGGEYKVNSSTDLTNWTEAADVTTDGATGTYNEDMIQQSARFYQVTRVR